MPDAAKALKAAEDDGRLLHDRIDFDERAKPWDCDRDLELMKPDAVIVADYGKGFVDERTVPRLRERWPEVPIVVDPARGSHWWSRYKGATVIKANYGEWRTWCGSDFHVTVPGASIVVTCGDIGMRLNDKLGVQPVTWEEIEAANGRIRNNDFATTP